MSLRGRISALLLQACLVLGWIVAPGADAWAYHREGSERLHPIHVSAFEAAPDHSLSGCSILEAATRPFIPTAETTTIVVFPVEIPEAAPIQPTPLLPSCAAYLPPSRAPPSL